jgi:hypothetical protein
MATHSMNEYRRAAFQLMARQNRRFGGAGRPTMKTYFEGDVMGREMAITLARLGWLTRLAGRNGRPSQVTLTDAGLWVLGGAS